MKTIFFVFGQIAAFLSVILGLLTLSPIAIAIGITTSACMIMLDGSMRRQEQLDLIQKEVQATRRELSMIRRKMEPDMERRIREESEEEIAAISFLTDDTGSDL